MLLGLLMLRYIYVLCIFMLLDVLTKKFLFACTLYQDQQPSVEQPQQEELPAEIQDITPGKEEVNGEDPVNHNEEKEKDASGGKVYVCIMS